MKSEELFRKLPRLEEPWIIKEIKFCHQGKRVHIFKDFPRGLKSSCPVCGIPYGVHDTEERKWRNLNIFQYPTYVQMQRTWKENRRSLRNVHHLFHEDGVGDLQKPPLDFPLYLLSPYILSYNCPDDKGSTPQLFFSVYPLQYMWDYRLLKRWSHNNIGWMSIFLIPDS